MTGTRRACPSIIQRLAARALASQISAFVVPESAMAAGRGLNLEAAGLELVSTPRHAAVLVVIDDLPSSLAGAAAVVYAQMPRPRWILAVGSGAGHDPLPPADLIVEADQTALADGVRRLRVLMRAGAFSEEISPYVADPLITRTQYTCPMHPEIIEDEPGNCPICGMDLVPQESTGESGDSHEHHDHHEAPGMVSGDSHEHHHHHEDLEMDSGDSHEHHQHHAEHDMESDDSHDHHHHGESSHHDDATSDDGRGEDHAGHDYGTDYTGGDHQMDHAGGMHGSGHEGHGDMDGFMSMIAMTKDLPRSPDGLPMEWVDAPFGPLFPGLPAGLNVLFTLDGDAVAAARIDADATKLEGLIGLPSPIAEFPGRLSRVDRLAPDAYRILALRALADAGVASWDGETRRYYAVVLEHQRISSHIVWLSRFGMLLGLPWLSKGAMALASQLERGNQSGNLSFRSNDIEELVARTRRTPLLKRRLVGIGHATAELLHHACGPNRRAGGGARDARVDDPLLLDLGFEPASSDYSDAYGRLDVRLVEILESARLVDHLTPVTASGNVVRIDETGVGSAIVETPRGEARLRVALDRGQVTTVELTTPSNANLMLAEAGLLGHEVADALVALASLDLSPWEIGL